eukprot:1159728-Pelagomonas_calceolata.AAC.3
MPGPVLVEHRSGCKQAKSLSYLRCCLKCSPLSKSMPGPVLVEHRASNGSVSNAKQEMGLLLRAIHSFHNGATTLENGDSCFHYLNDLVASIRGVRRSPLAAAVDLARKQASAVQPGDPPADVGLWPKEPCSKEHCFG